MSLDSWDMQEARDATLLGYVEGELVSLDELWENGDFGWGQELSQSDIRDRDVFIPKKVVKPFVFPHMVGRETYFEAVDALRKIILSAKTKGEIYWCSDACMRIDKFMECNVENWKTVVCTFDRLYPQFMKADARLQKTVLMPVAKIPRKGVDTVLETVRPQSIAMG